MKNLLSLSAVLLLTVVLMLESCGPVVVSTRLGNPPPPWFYPSRIERVRYVYFPQYILYYDLSMGSYICFDNGHWKRSNQLPSRYNQSDLKRSKFRRIPNYFDDNISNYHKNNINRRDNTSKRNN